MNEHEERLRSYLAAREASPAYRAAMREMVQKALAKAKAQAGEPE